MRWGECGDSGRRGCLWKRQEVGMLVEERKKCELPLSLPAILHLQTSTLPRCSKHPMLTCLSSHLQWGLLILGVTLRSPQVGVLGNWVLVFFCLRLARAFSPHGYILQVLVDVTTSAPQFSGSASSFVASRGSLLDSSSGTKTDF